MNERRRNSTETWIFPSEPITKGVRPVFPETPIKLANLTYLSRSRLRARQRRHERVFSLTSRAR